MSRFKAWFQGVRPQTLITSVAPVIMGTVIAYRGGSFHTVTLIMTLLFTLCTHIGTNLANDYFDFIKGADTEQRKGPHSALLSRSIAPNMMKRGMHLAFLCAFFLSWPLIIRSGYWTLPLFVLSILVGYGYSAGPWPLSYLGLGDPFVFLGFGPFATVGSAYLQSHTIEPMAIISGMGIGLVSVSLLIINHLRDIDEDRLANKKTLVVRFGKTFGKWEYFFCMIGAIFTLFFCGGGESFFSLFVNIAVGTPMLFLVWKVLRSDKNEKAIGPLFAHTARLLFIYPVAFIINYLHPFSA